MIYFFPYNFVIFIASVTQIRSKEWNQERIKKKKKEEEAKDTIQILLLVFSLILNHDDDGGVSLMKQKIRPLESSIIDRLLHVRLFFWNVYNFNNYIINPINTRDNFYFTPPIPRLLLFFFFILVDQLIEHNGAR